MMRRESFIDIHGYNKLAARLLWVIFIAELVAATVLLVLWVTR